MKQKCFLKKEDPVSTQGCIETSTFRKVLLYIKKEKTLEEKGKNCI